MKASDVAKCLLDIQAVQLDFDEGFRWVSGITSPIYCDNRLLISEVKERLQIAQGLADLIKEKHPQCNLIAGTATAGIAHAAWVADVMKLPMIYIRSKPKEHGTKSQLEGKYQKGDKIIVIEDLVSTGKSSVAAAKAARAEGLIVESVCSIFNYELKKADNNFTAAGISYSSLCGVSELIEYGLKSEQLSTANAEKLKDFFKGLDKPS